MRSTARIPLAAAVALALALLVACASSAPRAPTELLDERTGATLAVVAEPLVFARARADVAANARDYATLVAVEANRSGRYTQYLLLHRWSTVDRRMAALPPPAAGRLVLEADGRVLELHPLVPLPAALARRDHVFLPEDADVISWAYDTDLATLAYLAASHEIRLRLPDETLDSPFALWADGRAALREFAAR